uniref:Uncharacterized protein n=1 Tax=Nelumbo nucifera TaxID=4432 RepID=A0A822Y679_NELNU|nr:TPA_asm: hypothetical protein HUJ06_029001 [Nelumbo nucifera]
MQLIQNAEDNEYLPDVDPSLEFVIIYKDITGTGATATLLVFNNEKGFSRRDIESICSVGRSTKRGKRQEGFIGEKGQNSFNCLPYIFSNGYCIRFTEKPDPHCGIGYIVASWVDEKPTLDDLHKVYGSHKVFPVTTVVLPLRSEEVNAVKKQLSSVHPELLLFLSKIKRLSVREHNEVQSAVDTISAISISRETEFKTRRNINADSRIVFLSAKEGKNGAQKENDINEWVISLAFPLGERLKRGPTSIGADFILASSRETILLDNVWNQGIVDCVPVEASPYQELNGVRESIRTKMQAEDIIPCESFSNKRSSIGQPRKLVSRICMQHSCKSSYFEIC